MFKYGADVLNIVQDGVPVDTIECIISIPLDKCPGRPVSIGAVKRRVMGKAITQMSKE